MAFFHLAWIRLVQLSYCLWLGWRFAHPLESFRWWVTGLWLGWRYRAPRLNRLVQLESLVVIGLAFRLAPAADRLEVIGLLDLWLGWCYRPTPPTELPLRRITSLVCFWRRPPGRFKELKLHKPIIINQFGHAFQLRINFVVQLLASNQKGLWRFGIGLFYKFRNRII